MGMVFLFRDCNHYRLDEAKYLTEMFPKCYQIYLCVNLIPEKRYNFGNTYGETTRSMEVCAHNKSCFGEYMKGKAFSQSVA